MSEQKTLNKFEAIAAMVRDGAEFTPWYDKSIIYFYSGENIYFRSDVSLPQKVSVDNLPHYFRLYIETPKMKTWYRVFYRNKFDHIWETPWCISVEEARKEVLGKILQVPPEERQFPEVNKC